MKHPIRSAEDLGLVIRAVRKSRGVRQDDLASTVKVSKQFAVDVERGKPTVQFGRVLLLLKELGIALSVDMDAQALKKLAQLTDQRHAQRNTKALAISAIANPGAPAADDETKAGALP